ncbi:MAG: methyl-accepting chemotaxis protein [Rhodothalassiaceae bacterium]
MLRSVLTLRDWPFFVKFLASPALAIMLMVALLLLAGGTIAQLRDDTRRVVEEHFVDASALSELVSQFQDLNGRLFRALTLQAAGGEAEAALAEIAEIKAGLERLVAALAEFAEQAPSEQERAALQAQIDQIARFAEAADVVGVMLELDFAAAAGVVEPLEANYAEIITNLTEMVDAAVAQARATSEATSQAADDARANMTMIVTLALVVVLGISIFLARLTTGSVKAISSATQDLAGGQTDIDLSRLERRDELGAIVGALADFREGLIENARMREEQERLRAEQVEAERRRVEQESEAKRREEEAARRQRHQAEQDRKALLARLTADFEGSVFQGLQSLGRAAQGVGQEAEGMRQRLESSIDKSDRLAKVSVQLSDSMQSVAQATHQMTTGVQEISQQAASAADVSQQAVAEAEQSGQSVQDLSEAASQIGQVVALINDIAEQTNLLALNATIEAARAGEAGRGFAVVAAEVKSLAQQTGKATDAIRQKIEGIQSKTDDTVSSMLKIADIIQRVDSIAGAIATAIQQQGSATDEIRKTVSAAKGEIDAVADTAKQVFETAVQDSTAATAVIQATKQMNDGFGEVEKVSRRFLDDVARA